MRIALFVLAVLALVAGAGTNAMARSDLHQILSAIWYVIAAILLVGAAVVDAIVNLPERMRAKPEEDQQKTTEQVHSDPAISAETMDKLVAAAALLRHREEARNLDTFQADQFDRPTRS